MKPQPHCFLPQSVIEMLQYESMNPILNKKKKLFIERKYLIKFILI